MKNAKIVLVFFISLSSSIAYAQTKIKIYGNVDLSNRLLVNAIIVDSQYKQTYFQKSVYLSFAVQKNKKQKYTEYELCRFSIQNASHLNYIHKNNTGLTQVSSGERIAYIQLAFRIEKGRRFYNANKFSASYGVGVQPYITYLRTIPYTTFDFPINVTQAGTSLNFTPRINYYIANKLSLDLNVPFQFVDMNFKFTTLHNPALTQEIRKANLFSFDLPFLNNTPPMRLGMCYNL